MNETDNGEPFGCQTGAVAQAVSVYLGEKITAIDSDEDKEDFNNYMMFGIVMDDDENLILIVSPDDNERNVGGITSGDDWKVIDDHSRVRPAHEQECRDFIDEMSGELIRYYFSFLELV